MVFATGLEHQARTQKVVTVQRLIQNAGLTAENLVEVLGPSFAIHHFLTLLLHALMLITYISTNPYIADCMTWEAQRGMWGTVLPLLEHVGTWCRSATRYRLGSSTWMKILFSASSATNVAYLQNSQVGYKRHAFYIILLLNVFCVHQRVDVGGRYIVNFSADSLKTVTQNSHASFRLQCALVWQAVDGWRAMPAVRLIHAVYHALGHRALFDCLRGRRHVITAAAAAAATKGVANDSTLLYLIRQHDVLYFASSFVIILTQLPFC